jgi:hypothetical protein
MPFSPAGRRRGRGGEELCGCAVLDGCHGQREAVFSEAGADLMDGVADGAAADLEQFGGGLTGADLAVGRGGRQDPFRVGGLLGEQATGGSWPAGAAASMVTSAFDQSVRVLT